MWQPRRAITLFPESLGNVLPLDNFSEEKTSRNRGGAPTPPEWNHCGKRLATRSLNSLQWAVRFPTATPVATWTAVNNQIRRKYHFVDFSHICLPYFPTVAQENIFRKFLQWGALLLRREPFKAIWPWYAAYEIHFSCSIIWVLNVVYWIPNSSIGKSLWHNWLNAKAILWRIYYNSHNSITSACYL